MKKLGTVVDLILELSTLKGWKVGNIRKVQIKRVAQNGKTIPCFQSQTRMILSKMDYKVLNDRERERSREKSRNQR